MKHCIVSFRVYGNRPFVYEFLDEAFDQQYKNDESITKVIGYFTALAVVIACLGLYALSSFVISRRAKEIGVRKSLGANIKSIYLMLSWDFLKWILIASPAAYWLIDMWLNAFTYRIAISPDIFVIAALLSTGIASLTVTWQSLRAASANPVKALRYE